MNRKKSVMPQAEFKMKCCQRFVRKCRGTVLQKLSKQP